MSYPVYYVEENDTLPHLFDTFDGGTGASITMTGLAVTDIEIYKDGGTTQRASDSGYTLLDTDGIDFDGITGIHGFSIDLSDNTDAGFYAVGSWYHVVVSSVTVDAQTVSFVAFAFRITSATRGLAGTALPAAAADAAGGLPISDAGGLDLDAILADTADMQPKLGAVSDLGSGATIAANLVDIEGQTDDIGAAGAGLTAIPWNAAWDAEVQSEATDALNAYDPPTRAELTSDTNSILSKLLKYVQLLLRSDAAIATDNATELTAINANEGSGAGDYDNTADAVEALRDRGDAAWTSGSSSSPQLLQTTTIATLASQTSFTLTAGSADNNAYNGAMAIVTDSATSTQKAVGLVSAYVGATLDVTLAEDPGVFTMAVGDTVDIVAIPKQLPDAPHAANGGLPTVNASNYIAGIQGTLNTLDSLPTDASIADAVLQESVDDHKATANSLAEHIDEMQIDTNSLNDTKVPDTVSLANINTQVDTALTDIGLDHLLSVSVTGTDVADNSIIAYIMSKSATADFDSFNNTTDSLEAISDEATPTAAAIADAIWDELTSGHTTAGSFGKAITDLADTIWDEVVESGATANAQTARQMMRIMIAVLAGVTGETGDWSAKAIDGSKVRVSATLDASGNRTAVGTLDGS